MGERGGRGKYKDKGGRRQGKIDFGGVLGV